MASYCSIAELDDAYGQNLFERLCVRSDETSPVAPATIQARKQAALDEASGYMDGYFQPAYYIPVQTTQPSGLANLRQCCGVLAVASLVRQKGYVARSEDESLVIAADPWRKWLRDVAAGVVQIPGASQFDGQSHPGASAPRVGMVFKSFEPEVYDLQGRYF